MADPDSMVRGGGERSENVKVMVGGSPRSVTNFFFIEIKMRSYLMMIDLFALFRPGKKEKVGSATSRKTVTKATCSSNQKREKPSCGTTTFLTRKQVT